MSRPAWLPPEPTQMRVTHVQAANLILNFLSQKITLSCSLIKILLKVKYQQKQELQCGSIHDGQDAQHTDTKNTAKLCPLCLKAFMNKLFVQWGCFSETFQRSNQNSQRAQPHPTQWLH